MSEVATLGDAFSGEQARVREILGHYKEIGPAGMFGAALIENTLKKAETAAMSGDVTQIIVAYQELLEITD